MLLKCESFIQHWSDVIMGPMASQITSLAFVYPIVYSGADQRKYQSLASLARVRGIHRWPRQASNAENASIWWRHYESQTIQHGIIAHDLVPIRLQGTINHGSAKTLGSKPIRYRFDSNASDRYLIDLDTRVYIIWDMTICACRHEVLWDQHWPSVMCVDYSIPHPWIFLSRLHLITSSTSLNHEVSCVNTRAY